MHISDEQFKAYLTVQHSGYTNMYDVSRVIQFAMDMCDEELNFDQVQYIQQHYKELLERYGEL